LLCRKGGRRNERIRSVGTVAAKKGQTTRRIAEPSRQVERADDNANQTKRRLVRLNTKHASTSTSIDTQQLQREQAKHPDGWLAGRQPKVGKTYQHKSNRLHHSIDRTRHPPSTRSSRAHHAPQLSSSARPHDRSQFIPRFQTLVTDVSFLTFRDEHERRSNVRGVDQRCVVN
jgi:hypothetical protein